MKNIKKAYFIGIKGVGMTALAVFMKQKGIEVTGSDVENSFHTDRILKMYGIKIKKGFHASNVPQNADLVITTGAHGSFKNPESQEAIKRGIRTVSHAQALGEAMEGKIGISIAGSHGKTTTTAMTASVFKYAHLDPSYGIGAASIPMLGSGGHFGKGKYFITEADEYLTAPGIDDKPRFLWQNPQVVVLTNIEYDHPDAYKNFDDIFAAFQKFCLKVPLQGLLVLCLDDPHIKSLKKRLPKTIPISTFGFSPKADFQISQYKIRNKKAIFSLKYKNLDMANITLNVPGRHNAQNAVAAFIISHHFSVPIPMIVTGLENFQGSKRRFEQVGNLGDILLYDDYAHHPTEIVETLKAIKEIFPQRRIIVIFQPHTYSRTKALLNDFALAFLSSDELILVTEIFSSAREVKDEAISSKLLVDETLKRGKANIHYLPTKKDILTFLEKNKRQNDIIITMGAGDIYKLHDEIKLKLR